MDRVRGRRRSSLDGIVAQLEGSCDGAGRLSIAALSALPGFGHGVAESLEDQLGAGPWDLQDIRAFLENILPDEAELPRDPGDTPPESPSAGPEWRYEGLTKLQQTVRGAMQEVDGELPLTVQEVQQIIALQRDKLATLSPSARVYADVSSELFSFVELLWQFSGRLADLRAHRTDALEEDLDKAGRDLAYARGQLKLAQEAKAAASKQAGEQAGEIAERGSALEALQAQVEGLTKARLRAEDFSRELQVKLKLAEAFASQESRRAKESPKKLSVVEQAAQARKIRELECAHAELADLPTQLAEAEARCAASDAALRTATASDEQRRGELAALRTELLARDEAERSGAAQAAAAQAQAAAVLHHRQLSALEREKEAVEKQRGAALRAQELLQEQLAAAEARLRQLEKRHQTQVPRSVQSLQHVLSPVKPAMRGPGYLEHLERLVRDLTEELRRKEKRSTPSTMKVEAVLRAGSSTASTCDDENPGPSPRTPERRVVAGD